MDTLKLLDDLKTPPVQSTLLTRREIANRAVDQPPFDSSHADDAASLWQRLCDKGLVYGVHLLAKHLSFSDPSLRPIFGRGTHGSPHKN